MSDKAVLKKFISDVMQVLPQVIRGFLRTQGNALSRGQISPQQYFVIETLDRMGARTMSELAAELEVSLPAMSGLIDRLYKLKMVKRFYPEKDRRVIRIEITAHGQKTLKIIKVQRETGFRKIFGQLTQRDRVEYLRIITKVRDILDDNSRGQG